MLNFITIQSLEASTSATPITTKPQKFRPACWCNIALYCI